MKKKQQHRVGWPRPPIRRVESNGMVTQFLRLVTITRRARSPRPADRQLVDWQRPKIGTLCSPFYSVLAGFSFDFFRY